MFNRKLLYLYYMPSRRIIGIGETVLDVIFRNDRPQDAIPGGSTFNALISLGRTLPKKCPGTQILMVTEVGDDHIGDIIVSFMEANGVSSEAVTRHPGGQSHLSMAFLDENNDAQYEFYKDHAHAGLSPQKTESLSFSKDDIVLFGSFFAINPAIRDHTRRLLQNARAAGAILYYDINFRRSHVPDIPETMAGINENCRLADFVRGSAEDFQILFGTEDGRKVYEEHIAPLCGNFILTRGGRPTEIYLPGGARLSCPVPQIETVSTIGAGDNFNAGFIYALVRNGIFDASSIDGSVWAGLHSTASRFSSAACQSINNYVDDDFYLSL